MDRVTASKCDALLGVTAVVDAEGGLRLSANGQADLAVDVPVDGPHITVSGLPALDCRGRR